METFQVYTGGPSRTPVPGRHVDDFDRTLECDCGSIFFKYLEHKLHCAVCEEQIKLPGGQRHES